MNDKEQELLAQFHQTISEQLNARLSESPKFFGLLIVVSTGYGYVLFSPALSSQKGLLILASLLSYTAVIWSSWYLAALGYAFRFLQNSQHCIEHALGWNPGYVPLPENGRPTGKPPSPPKTIFDRFWLLPGIYHPHAAGHGALLVIICTAFCCYSWKFWPHRCLLAIGCIAIVAGLGSIFWMNSHYLDRFRKRWRDPASIASSRVLVNHPHQA
jgi:hypothetical protein